MARLPGHVPGFLFQLIGLKPAIQPLVSLKVLIQHIYIAKIFMFRVRTRRDGPTKQVSDLNPLWIQGIIPGPPLGGPRVLKPVEGGGMLTFMYIFTAGMFRCWCYADDATSRMGLRWGGMLQQRSCTLYTCTGVMMLRRWCYADDATSRMGLGWLGVAWGWVGCSRSDGWMSMLWNCYADIRPFMAGSKILNPRLNIWLLFSMSYMGCHPSHWRTHIFQDG